MINFESQKMFQLITQTQWQTTEWLDKSLWQSDTLILKQAQWLDESLWPITCVLKPVSFMN